MKYMTATTARGRDDEAKKTRYARSPTSASPWGRRPASPEWTRAKRARISMITTSGFEEKDLSAAT